MLMRDPTRIEFKAEDAQEYIKEYYDRVKNNDPSVCFCHYCREEGHDIDNCEELAETLAQEDEDSKALASERSQQGFLAYRRRASNAMSMITGLDEPTSRVNKAIAAAKSWTFLNKKSTNGRFGAQFNPTLSGESAPSAPRTSRTQQVEQGHLWDLS